MHGNRIDDTDLGERGINRNTTYGFTFGGPIVKNKLFFLRMPNMLRCRRSSTAGVLRKTV